MEDPLDAHFDKKKTELKEEKMQASSISGLITGRIGRFTDWQQGTANAWRKSRRKLSSRTGSRGKFNKRERNSTQNVERNVITDKWISWIFFFVFLPVKNEHEKLVLGQDSEDGGQHLTQMLNVNDGFFVWLLWLSLMSEVPSWNWEVSSRGRRAGLMPYFPRPQWAKWRLWTDPGGCELRWWPGRHPCP